MNNIGNFVFDLDGTIAIPIDYEIEKKEKIIKDEFGDSFFNKHRIMAHNYPHFIFPGYYALFRWLNSLGGKILFFSSGIEERNIELVNKLMEICFGDLLPNIEYKVFSRQHCIDTTNLREDRDIYQSFFYGQRKKKLAGIVVREEELSNSLLIDDDNSYMVKGEEFNLILLAYGYQYISDDENRKFYIFHRAYYLAGIFNKIFEIKEEKNISLVQAAKFVQIDLENSILSRDFYYPGYYNTEYYLKGKEILTNYDDSLVFYYKIPNNNLKE